MRGASSAAEDPAALQSLLVQIDDELLKIGSGMPILEPREPHALLLGG
jgi:hypothetical protein